MAVLFLAFAASAVLTTMSVVTDRTRDVWMGSQELVARQAAQGAVHQVIATVHVARDMGNMLAPFSAIEAMDTAALEGPGYYTQLLNGQAIKDSLGKTVAEVDAYIDVLNRADLNFRDVAITAYAYVPSKLAVNNGVRDSIDR